MNNKSPLNARININIETLETLTCPNCTNSTFKTNLSTFKKLPSLQSPNGQEQLIKLDLITCSFCDSHFILKGCELEYISKNTEKVIN